MENNRRIRNAQSCASDAREAVREFHAAVAQPNTALVIFFCSSEYDLDALADEMSLLFAGIQVVGCTTAGEIGPAGYRDHSLTGTSFPASSFTAVSDRIANLEEFKIATGQEFVQKLLQTLENKAPQANPDNSFAFMLIDGLSLREESVTRALQSSLGTLPLVGGSAGDGLNFSHTHVYFNGQFYSNSAILILVTTRLPFKPFKTQHFIATEERLVVTKTDTDHRIVSEINGLPAAEEYARIVGINLSDLEPLRFATWPVVIMIDGTNYVRSIQKANPDGSLTFFCAIEEGLVLRVAKGVDMLENLEQAFTQLRADIGQPQLVLGCDCILRKLDISPNIKSQVNTIFQQNNTVGFSTYGEQFHGVHINQTLVGIAIGTDSKEIKDA